MLHCEVLPFMFHAQAAICYFRTSHRNTFIVNAKPLQVITGLTTLQSAIGDLIHAYLAHTNNILGGGPSTGADTLAISNPLGFSGTSVDIASKKKKAKKERDPNAPKRPLTAYFLYAQHARKIIREDLGADNIDLKPGDIATEATRRWHAMSLEEQEVCV